MKRLVAIFGLTLMGLAIGCSERTDATAETASGLLYRHHFAGAAQIAQTTNATTLKEIGALPATRELREHVLGKLAKAPQDYLRKQLPPGAADQSALLRPLLDDLVSAESYLELHGPTNRVETLLAIQLNDQRAQLWSTNLWQVAKAWKLGSPGAIMPQGFPGWELKKLTAPNLFQFVRAGKWVVIGLGHDRLTQLPAMLQQISKGIRPGTPLGNSWLEAEADCPRLGAFVPLLATYGIRPARLSISSKDGNLITNMRLLFRENVSWTFEPWKVPTNLVREPLISFTAARGIAPLLRRTKGVADLGLNPLPDQLCAWGQAHTYVQSSVVMPVDNATNAIRQVAPRLPPFILSYLPDALGKFLWVSNKSELAWQGVPFLMPSLYAVREGGVDYLLGSLFPMPRRNDPPPTELFAQLSGRSNLLYYDWELTQERLPQANRLWQLCSAICKRQIPPTTVPTTKWIAAVAPHLGNTVTVITQTGPKELTLVRKSQLGLTAFEIATLARWTESAGFPRTFEWPPPLKTMTTKDSVKKP